MESHPDIPPPEFMEAQTDLNLVETVSLVVLIKDTSVPIEALCEYIAKEIAARGRDYELIFIGSDRSGRCWETISHLSGADDRVSGFCSSSEIGENGMLATGMEIAKGNIVLETSTDIHSNPRCLGRLLGRIEKILGTGEVATAQVVQSPQDQSASLTEQLLISAAARFYRAAA